MIRLNQVYKRYPSGFEALRNVSFEVARGEMVFVTGHSGAGKSTLLKLLTRMEVASRGEILVNGKNLSRLPARQLPFFRRSVGVVFQDYKLLPDRTVFDNVALPLVVAGLDSREIARRVRAALALVGLLDKEKLPPITLSGGEQQRVGIARAVVGKPPLLLADEPTGNLDAALSQEILALFRDFNDHGVTVVIASHDQQLIGRAGKRVLELRHGELIDDRGAPA
jgi:cell division transport system ATP-binding protein